MTRNWKVMQLLLILSLSTIKAELDATYLLNVGKQLGNYVHALGIQLGLSDADIDNIKASEQHIAGNWGYKVLKSWMQRQETHEDSPEILALALREIGRRDLERQVRAYKWSAPENGAHSSQYSNKRIPESAADHTEGNNNQRGNDLDDFALLVGIVIAILIVTASLVAIWRRGGIGVVASADQGNKGQNEDGGVSEVNAKQKPTDVLDDRFLLQIGNKVGNATPDLGIQLGLGHPDIEHIKSGSQHDPQHWGVQVLNLWKQRTTTKDDQRKLLADALKAISKNRLAEEVENYVVSENR